VIYLDHNATTPLDPEVAAFLARAYAELSANPSSTHQAGQAARSRLDRARAGVAELLGARPKEIVFTGSASEANALAIKGAWATREPRRTRVVVSAIEHPSVGFACDQLERRGAVVTRVAPEPSGRVDAQRMIAALGDDVAICSLQWANNETGVLQPVGEVARACRARGIRFHTDAVQAFGRVPVTLRDADADLLSLSAHKTGGPAGVGVLVVRTGVELESLVPGHQEHGLRGGTQALVAIEAASLAFARAHAQEDARAPTLAGLRDSFEQQVLDVLPGTRVNGTAARLPNTSNLRFAGVDGESLLIALDLAGVAASSGSACASGTLKPSHVLLAMGLTAAEAKRSLRFSFGASTTVDEVTRAIEILVSHVRSARA
jgi:cysteine desulfurase